MVRPLSAETEEKILSTLQDVTGLVEADGLSPTEAIVKVAREQKTPLTLVPLLVQAYNVGRCSHQREIGEGVLGKTAQCDLAEPKTVMEQLTAGTAKQDKEKEEEEEKKAALAEYAKPPVWAAKPSVAGLAKAAEAAWQPKTPPLRPTPERERWQKRQQEIWRKEAEQRETEQARRRAHEARDAFISSLTAVKNYFRKSAYDRTPFAVVAYNARHLCGDAAVTLLNHVYDDLGLREPRQAPLTKVAQEATLAMEPYSLIDRCCRKAAQAIALHAALPREKTAEEEKSPRSAQAKSPVLTGFFRKEAEGSNWQKLTGKATSSIGAFMDWSTGGSFADVMKPKTKAELLQAAIQEGPANVEHLTNLRKIRAETMLADFLVNDDVLSSYHPEDVTMAYNELAQLSPRAALQAAIIRPLLRKRMQSGALEPFEVEQLVKMETQLKQQEDNESLSSD